MMLWWHLRQARSMQASVREAAVERLGTSNDRRAVEPLIAALGDESPLVRIKAARGLGLLGDQRAVQPLLDTLEASADVPLRQAVIQALVALQAPQAVKAYSELLRDDKMRQLAAEALVAVGVPAVEPLLPLLTSRETQVRATAAAVLGRIGEGWVAEALVERLADEVQVVREAAAQALSQLGWAPTDPVQRALDALARQDWQLLAQLQSAAVPPLVAALHDLSLDVRLGAVRTLGAIQTVEALEALVNELQDPSPTIRASVVQSLGPVADDRTMARLTAILGDGDPAVCQAVTDALLQRGATAVEPLIGALRSPDPEVRRAAVDLLGQIGDQRGVQILEAALSDPELPVALAAVEASGRLGAAGQRSLATALESHRGEVRRAAANALAGTGWRPGRNEERALLAVALEDWDGAAQLGAPAVAALVNILGDADPERRAGAARALTSIGAPATDALVAVVADERWEVRQMAARILGPSGEARAIQPLISLAADLSTSVREEAIRALGHSDDPQAVAALKAALHDRAFAVQVAAAEALRKLNWQPDSEDEFLLQALAERQWRKLAEKGIVQAIAPMLQHLYEMPRHSRHEEIHSALLALAPISALSEELVDWIVDAASYEHVPWSPVLRIDHDSISLRASDRAVRLLCQVNTPVTSNALHLVSQKRDIAVHLDSRCAPSDAQVTFQDQRQMALQELQRRGAPPYRAEVYLEPRERDTEIERRSIVAALQREQVRRYAELKKQIEQQHKYYGGLIYGQTMEPYEELARDFKTPEVQALLADALSRGRFIDKGERRKFELLVEGVRRHLRQ